MEVAGILFKINMRPPTPRCLLTVEGRDIRTIWLGYSIFASLFESFHFVHYF